MDNYESRKVIVLPTVESNQSQKGSAIKVISENTSIIETSKDSPIDREVNFDGSGIFQNHNPATAEQLTYENLDKWKKELLEKGFIKGKGKFPTPKRVWINAPSTQQYPHRYHGRAGIAHTNPENGFTTIYFAEGDVIDMLIDPIYLETKNSQANVFKLGINHPYHPIHKYYHPNID